MAVGMTLRAWLTLAEAIGRRSRQAVHSSPVRLRDVGDAWRALCSVCGTAVPNERLEAVPATRRCVSCQAGHREKIR
jgi:RNA polymerase-binding transcription factor DksA